jgi:pilus assembly protein Flp/PilA
MAREDATGGTISEFEEGAPMIQKRLERQLLEDDGATAVEYAIIAGFLSIVIVGTVLLIGQTVGGYFQAAATWF